MEAPGVTLTESRLVLAALDGLAEPMVAAGAAEVLAHICEDRGLTAVAARLDGWGR
jgi:hypothetical protein